MKAFYTMRIIPIKNPQRIFIFSFLDVLKTTRMNIIDNILDTLPLDKRTGYAGFTSKRNLRKHLDFHLSLKKSKKKEYKNLIDEKRIISLIKKNLKRVFKVLPLDFLYIYIFPTFNEFVKQKMKGIVGASFRENVILIHMYPEIRKVDIFFDLIFMHEYNHAARLKYFPLKRNNTLLDSLIMEGLADNFAISLTGASPKCVPWLRVLNKKQAKELLCNLKKRNLLFSKDEKVHWKVFFGGDQFPFWAGYSLGFYIVKEFIQKSNLSNQWQQIIKIEAQKFLDGPSQTI